MSPQQPRQIGSGLKRNLDLSEGSDRHKAHCSTSRDLFQSSKDPIQLSQHGSSPPAASAQSMRASQAPLVQCKAEQGVTYLANLGSCPTFIQPDAYSLLPKLIGRSSEVMQARLSNYDLPPESSSTGQSLIKLELRMQALLGMREAEDSPDAVCWVDNGILLHPEGVKCFHISYGDAECAQVLTSFGLSRFSLCLAPV